MGSRLGERPEILEGGEPGGPSRLGSLQPGSVLRRKISWTAACSMPPRNCETRRCKVKILTPGMLPSPHRDGRMEDYPNFCVYVTDHVRKQVPGCSH